MKTVKVKLTVTVDLFEYRQKLAKEHNLKPEEVEIVVHNEQPLALPKEKGMPLGDMEYTEGEKGDPSPKKKERHHTFLEDFMAEHELKNGDVATLCGVSEPTVKRMKAGYKIENPTFDKVVDGLGLNAEQATALRKGLNRKQRRAKK